MQVREAIDYIWKEAFTVTENVTSEDAHANSSLLSASPSLLLPTWLPPLHLFPPKSWLTACSSNILNNHKFQRVCWSKIFFCLLSSIVILNCSTKWLNKITRSLLSKCGRFVSFIFCKRLYKIECSNEAWACLVKWTWFLSLIIEFTDSSLLWIHRWKANCSKRFHEAHHRIAVVKFSAGMPLIELKTIMRLFHFYRDRRLNS